MLLAALCATTAAQAEELRYGGTGTFFASRVLMPLSNGGAAVKMDNEVVLSIDPSPTGFLFGECTGLGYISPDGTFTSTAYCTLREDDTHSMDVRAERAEGGASGTVIGGSGRWKGATGTVTMKSRFNDGARGSFDYQMVVNTP
jgi:hypothetical protein